MICLEWKLFETQHVRLILIVLDKDTFKTLNATSNSIVVPTDMVDALPGRLSKMAFRGAAE